MLFLLLCFFFNKIITHFLLQNRLDLYKKSEDTLVNPKFRNRPHVPFTCSPHGKAVGTWVQLATEPRCQSSVPVPQSSLPECPVASEGKRVRPARAMLQGGLLNQDILGIAACRAFSSLFTVWKLKYQTAWSRTGHLAVLKKSSIHFPRRTLQGSTDRESVILKLDWMIASYGEACRKQRLLTQPNVAVKKPLWCLHIVKVTVVLRSLVWFPWGTATSAALFLGRRYNHTISSEWCSSFFNISMFVPSVLHLDSA